MKNQFIATVTALLLTQTGFAQNKFISTAYRSSQNVVVPTYEHCKQNWDYVFVRDTLSGEILFYAAAPFACGTVQSAAVFIIKTSRGDSLRVIVPCETATQFKKGQKIICTPIISTNGVAALPFNTSKMDCQVRKTIYAYVKPGML